METNDLFLSETFFPLVREGMGLSAQKETLPETIDYPLLIDTAKRQAIVSVIGKGLEASGLMGECLENLQTLCMTEVYLFAHRDAALECIKACFDKNGVDYVLLKGSVLRDLYPDPWMRTSCDIDVLVREEDLDRAVSLLVRDTDFRFVKRRYHDVALINGQVHLELHFNIKENKKKTDPLLSKAWEYAVRQPGTHQLRFTPEFQIFHIVAHMAYHFVNTGLGVRPYLDLWLLRHKTEYDENAVRRMCEQGGLLTFYERCCDLSAVWFEKREHDSVTEALEEYSFNGGALGDARNTFIVSRKNNRGVRFFWKKLFLDRPSLETMYPKLKKHPCLLPFYQVKRWFRALFFKRAKIKKEIKILQSVKKEEIQSLSQLFDAVGL